MTRTGWWVLSPKHNSNAALNTTYKPSKRIVTPIVSILPPSITVTNLAQSKHYYKPCYKRYDVSHYLQCSYFNTDDDTHIREDCDNRVSCIEEIEHVCFLYLYLYYSLVVVSRVWTPADDAADARSERESRRKVRTATIRPSAPGRRRLSFLPLAQPGGFVSPGRA